MKRGDVVLAYYPYASGTGGSRRPALVVQSDALNQKISNTIIAQITSNLGRKGDPAHVLIDVSTPEGKQSGLLHDSLVSCNNLATVDATRINKVIGSLPDALMNQVDASLKAALGLK
jgi:mRNA interferase MazF